jgi:hypothetical protein
LGFLEGQIILRGLRNRRLLLLPMGLLLLVATFSVIAKPTKTGATAGINSQINFQGKISNTTGSTNIADGTYNMQFKIYQDGDGLSAGDTTGAPAGTLKWTESRLVQASQGVTVTNGIFQVNLGSVTSLPGSIDFNSNTIWLSINVGNTNVSCTPFTSCSGDGEMLPMVRFTAVPYALNSNNLGGIAASGFVQVSPGSQQTGNINISGTVTSGQVNGQTISSSSIFSGTVAIQGINALTLGVTGTSSGAILLKGATAASGTITLQSPTNPGTFSLTLPSALGANGDCLKDSSGTGVLAFGSCGSGSFVNLQATTPGTPQTGNLNISGVGIFGTGISVTGSSTFTLAASNQVAVNASAAPTVDMVSINNTGQAVTTAGVNGLSINYVGGNAAVEAAGARIDYASGGTTGGTWSGLRIVANATGPATGVTSYGIKIEGPTSPSAGTEKGMYIGTGWDTGLDVQSGGLNLAGYTSGGSPADPAAPATDNLRVYAKKVSGRMLLKIKGPSGLDSPLQPALFGNNIALWAPNSAAVGTGTGFGTIWQSNGTVSHPVPVTTAPAMSNQIHRTRYANIVTATNQVLGPKVNTTSENDFWIGNAAGLGGFFFNTRFVVDLWPASTVRIFAGLSSSTTAVVASDTVAGDVVGLWHDTTDPATGANSFNLVTRNNTTTTKTSIALSNAIAAGNSYDFFMFVKPNDTTVYYRLDDIVNGVTYEGSSATTLPRNTIFMGPQVEMSNGTANTVVTTTAIGVARIYLESDH